mgnify:FL=1|jgi:hypothetical protein
MNQSTIKVGTVIQHKHSHKIAKITDVYYPPDNPYVISLSYRYVDTDNTRSIIDTDLENFIEKWDVLDAIPQENKPIPV